MKTGWLVYRPEEVTRNRVFIDKWMAAAQKRGVDLRLATADMLLYGISGGRAFVRAGVQNGTPDFAVMRLNDPVLTETFEAAGIPCFNGSHVARVCNDKQRTHLMFSGVLPMLDTVFLQEDVAGCPFPYPVVVKAAHSCGGQKVFLCRDDGGFSAAVNACRPDSVLVQPCCDTPGRDLRVYVVGNRIVTAMTRFSTDGDFRSNLHQGGSAAPFPLNSAVKAYVETVLERFDFGLAGIDFIFHKGEVLFNEIEDAVGTRMLYIHTGLNIVEMYLDHILSRLSATNVTIQ